MGLLNDAPALAQAGYIKTSGVLSLVSKLREETECMICSSTDRSPRLIEFFAVLVLDSAAGSLESILSTWWEHKDIKDKLDTIRRVRQPLSFVKLATDAFCSNCLPLLSNA